MKSTILHILLLLITSQCLAQTKYNSKNNFSFEVIKGWKKMTDAELIAANERTQTDNVEAIFFDDKVEPRSTISIIFQPDSSFSDITFFNFLHILREEKVIEQSGVIIKERKDLISEHNFSEPFIDRENGVVYLNSKSEIPNAGLVLGFSIMAPTKKGIIAISYYILEENFLKYKGEVLKNLNSLKVPKELKLKRI